MFDSDNIPVCSEAVEKTAYDVRENAEKYRDDEQNKYRGADDTEYEFYHSGDPDPI